MLHKQQDIQSLAEKAAQDPELQQQIAAKLSQVKTEKRVPMEEVNVLRVEIERSIPHA